MTDSQTTISDLKSMMATFVAERNWHKFHTPRNLAASTCVEAGELLEHFQWLTAEEAIDRSRNDADFRKAVGEELSDVLMYLLSLANSMDLDVAAAAEAKMVKNRAKYPAEKFNGNYQRPVPKD
ncbi:MAG TPA: nucleotide pyrophosphohydrolase [Tepidisphaeraceae bacterium]|jgi:NTP pyrophosphatase (non-canonical NTP hydrolase)|nr:nucleotide pyrophosphohydrolase [Tepidisphaeraceae bacterium]